MTQLEDLQRGLRLTGILPEQSVTIVDVKGHGTGLLCGEALGNLSGAVTLTDTTPAADVHINLYRSTEWLPWQPLAHHLAPQYYAVKPTIVSADLITITRAVICAIGTPDAVTLTLSTGPHYTMANVSGDLYQATIPAADLTGNATLSVASTCGVTTTETLMGYLTLYDPSSYVTNYLTGAPVVGATVTLSTVTTGGM